MALTEKGTQRIVIIVRKQVDGSQVGAKEKSADESKEDDTQGVKKAKSAAWKRTQYTHAMATAKQMASQWFGYAVAGIGYENGDAALQQQINRQIEQVTDYGNVATSVAMGMTYGAAGGPWGVVLGGLIMGTQTASSTLLKYANRQRDYDMALYKQNNAIEYKRARAQINLTTGRLR